MGTANAILLSLAMAAAGQDPAKDAPPPAAPAPVEMTAPVRESVERGLAWLSRAQSPSGAYGSGSAPVATTSIAAMAFVVGGHLPGRSPYGENVRKALAFILKNTGHTGYINEGQTRNVGGSGMHGHGYATLFMAECCGMTDEIPGFDAAMLKEKLTRAVRVIERSQTPNGGWNYEPRLSSDPGNTYDEGSVTITQVQALRAARNVGIAVNMGTIEKAIEYINKSTDEAGQTRYSLNSGGHTSFALTAAGMSVLNFLGAYDNPKIKKGLDSLLLSPPGEAANASAAGGWFFYGNYYATLACYQAGSPYWEKWWPLVSADLVRAQSSDGSWKEAESVNYGAAFGTGMALQILQLPARYSPIYQRGSD